MHPYNLGLFAPLLYYTNTWYGKYLPMSSSTAWDNTGKAYNVQKVLNPNTTLNLAAYKAYSPIFLSTTWALSYAFSFAATPAYLVHTFLYYRKQIWIQARRSLSEQPDIHARLMSKYREVPDWWYALIFSE